MDNICGHVLIWCNGFSILRPGVIFQQIINLTELLNEVILGKREKKIILPRVLLALSDSDTVDRLGYNQNVRSTIYPVQVISNYGNCSPYCHKIVKTEQKTDEQCFKYMHFLCPRHKSSFVHLRSRRHYVRFHLRIPQHSPFPPRGRAVIQNH